MQDEKWKVLLVVDESMVSDRAVDCAIDLCLSGLENEICLLYVADIEPMPVPSEKDEKKLYGTHRAKANKKMLDIMEKLRNAGIDGKILEHHFGIAAEKIEKVEKEEGIDMIVIGAEKPSILSKLMGGHYSEKTIFETKTPVLIVKPEYEPKIKKIIEDKALKPIKVLSREKKEA